MTASPQVAGTPTKPRPGSFAHTRAYLEQVFGTSSSSCSGPQPSSPSPQPPPPLVSDSSLSSAASSEDDVDGDVRADADPVASILRIIEDGDPSLEEAKLDNVRSAVKKGLEEKEGRWPDSSRLDAIILDIMWRHKEDVSPSGMSFPAPLRRSASSTSTPGRPWTPTRATSPAVPSATLSTGGSPRASPRLFARTIPGVASTGALPGYPSLPSPVSAVPPLLGFGTSSRPVSPSPLGSPRFNVGALEFKPRAPSSAGSPTPAFARPATGLRSESLFNRTGATSPLPSHSLAQKNHPAGDEEDEFNPFAASSGPVRIHGPGVAASPDADGATNATAAGPMSSGWSGYGGILGDSDRFSSSASTTSSSGGYEMVGFEEFYEEEDGQYVGAYNMTAFDVLYSILAGSGTTMTPEQVEEALSACNYDVEAAMAFIMDNGGMPSASSPVATSGGSQPRTSSSPSSVAGPSVHRPVVVSRDQFVAQRPGRAGSPLGSPVPRFGSPGPGSRPGWRQPPAPARVCRYFLAGDCRRADCRFSHDLERALCRFWLRGQCLNDPCAFLHDLDIVNSLVGRMNDASASLDSRNGSRGATPEPQTPPPEEFPELSGGVSSTPQGGRRKWAPLNADPDRARFAAALKRHAPQPLSLVGIRGNRHELGGRYTAVHARGAPVSRQNPVTTPSTGGPPGPRSSHKPSPRITLRSPSHLPTLATGPSLESLYMTYRTTSLSLGENRNKCLTRAAEAWKRGDGAAAKRWSKEGQELNRRMVEAGKEAASNIVKERMRIVREEMAAGDPSTFGGDRSERAARGKLVGNGLGVCLGVASKQVAGSNLTAEERMEAMLDLHGLHASEAINIIEEFLLALEQEHFLGLAYLVVGEGRHSGASDAGVARRRVRLMNAVKEFLNSWCYPYREEGGVVCVDQCTHA